MRFTSYIAIMCLCIGIAAAQAPSGSGIPITVRIDIKSKAGTLISRDEKTREYSNMEMCEHIAREEQAIAEEHLGSHN